MARVSRIFLGNLHARGARAISRNLRSPRPLLRNFLRRELGLTPDPSKTAQNDPQTANFRAPHVWRERTFRFHPSSGMLITWPGVSPTCGPVFLAFGPEIPRYFRESFAKFAGKCAQFRDEILPILCETLAKAYGLAAGMHAESQLRVRGVGGGALRCYCQSPNIRVPLSRVSRSIQPPPVYCPPRAR